MQQGLDALGQTIRNLVFTPLCEATPELSLGRHVRIFSSPNNNTDQGLHPACAPLSPHLPLG